MTIFFPLIELVDRYCIAKLKFEKTQLNANELEFYKTQLDNIDMSSVQTLVDDLYSIHSTIWSLESDLKTGLEEKHSLEDIGRTAIEIRNWNNKRVNLKNTIATTLGQGHILEIKQNHISE